MGFACNTLLSVQGRKRCAGGGWSSGELGCKQTELFSVLHCAQQILHPRSVYNFYCTSWHAPWNGVVWGLAVQFVFKTELSERVGSKASHLFTADAAALFICVHLQNCYAPTHRLLRTSRLSVCPGLIYNPPPPARACTVCKGCAAVVVVVPKLCEQNSRLATDDDLHPWLNLNSVP